MREPARSGRRWQRPMHRGPAALVSSVLLAVASLPAQVEVLAGPGSPSSLLRTRLAKEHDEFVLLDTGCVVYELVIALQFQVSFLEHDRARALADVLPQIA